MTTLLPNDAFTLSLITIIAICIGSFLNVVILRLPKMLHQSYEKEASFILNQPYSQNRTQENIHRHSACQSCHAPLKVWHNVPIISYLPLKGKCQFCKKSISIQYPLVEALSGVLCLLTCYYYGISLYSLA